MLEHFNPLIAGSGESIQSIRVHDKVIVSMTGNNRIAWHTFTDKEVNFNLLRVFQVGFSECPSYEKCLHSYVHI